MNIEYLNIAGVERKTLGKLAVAASMEAI